MRNQGMDESYQNEDKMDFLTQDLQKSIFRAMQRMLELQDKTQIGKITELGHLMPPRTLSKPGVEALIMSTLLRLDTKAIFNEPKERRIQKVIELRKSWPAHMLFNAASRKTTEPGFRWAPISFIEKGVSPFVVATDSSDLDEGLVGNLSSKEILDEQGENPYSDH